MSDPQVEMKTILAHELRPDQAFEMFGNLYQIDGVFHNSQFSRVRAHLIAQVGIELVDNPLVDIKISAKTPVQIEA